MVTKNLIDCDLEKLDEIISYNENVLGIQKNILSGSFLNIKDEIFYLVNFFSCIDTNFRTNLLQQLLNDVLHFLDIYEQIENANILEHCKIDPNSSSSSEQINTYTSKLKNCKLKTISIINTRLYCIDSLMWDLVKNSKKIKRFVNIFEVGKVNNTQEFLKIQKYDLKPMFKSTYTPSSNELKPLYHESELKIIQSLKNDEVNELSEGINHLLKSKSSIGFFENMSDEEIKLIVNCVKFSKYDRGEVITKQGDRTKEMFFIISGECTVIQDNKIVGKLGPKQIFGEFSKITNRNRFATVITKTQTTLLSFNLKLELFDEAPFSFSTLYKNILAELVKKIDISNHYKQK